MFFQNLLKKKIIFLLIKIAISYIFFFLNLGSYSLKEPDEGRYAEIPREMVETGDYIVPHLNYVRYFEKPPLLYWMVALSYKIIGVNEWSFRLPNALFALIGVVITFLFVERWFNEKIAFITSMILMSSFGFFAMGRIVTIDMLFAVLLFISLSCFFRFYKKKESLFLYLFYTTLALATLTKGPVALILLGITIFLFLLSEKNFLFLKQMTSIKGILLYIFIAMPWFVTISLKEKEFFNFFFVDQHILRFLTTKHHRSGPIYYFFPVVFGGLFPWSVFLPLAMIRLWRVKELKLFFIWSFVVFSFFSISGSKLPPYILPIFPALSIILGYFFEREWLHSVRKCEIIIYFLCFAIFSLVGFFYGLGLLDRYLNGLIHISFTHKDIRGLSLGISFISLSIITTLIFKKMRPYFKSLFFILWVFSFSIVIGLMFHAHVIDRVNTTKELAQKIKAEKKVNSIIVNYGSFDETLPFYTCGRTYLAAYSGELEMGSKYNDAKKFFLNEDEFVRLFKSDKDVWVVFKTKKVTRLKELLSIDDDNMITCQNTRCVVNNGR